MFLGDAINTHSRVRITFSRDAPAAFRRNNDAETRCENTAGHVHALAQVPDLALRDCHCSSRGPWQWCTSLSVAGQARVATEARRLFLLAGSAKRGGKQFMAREPHYRRRFADREIGFNPVRPIAFGLRDVQQGRKPRDPDDEDREWSPQPISCLSRESRSRAISVHAWIFWWFKCNRYRRGWHHANKTCWEPGDNSRCNIAIIILSYSFLCW